MRKISCSVQREVAYIGIEPMDFNNQEGLSKDES